MTLLTWPSTFTGEAAVPYSWRVLLALEHKGLPYTSHLLQLAMQEHKSPHMLALNPRGRVPVLKDGDYVVFESLAVLYYLDRKYPAEAAVRRFARRRRGHHARVLRIPGVHRDHVMRIARALLYPPRRSALRRGHHTPCTWSAGEARTIEMRLSKGDWIVGDKPGAADYMIYPGHQAAAARARASRSARAVVALPAGRSELSGARPLDAARRVAARLRENLSAALARAS